MSETLIINFTKDSENLTNLELEIVYNLSYDGITIVRNNNDEAPLPWDASYEIKVSKLVIEGGVDACGFGQITIKLPIEEASKYYRIEVEPYENDEDSANTDIIRKIFLSHKYKVKES